MYVTLLADGAGGGWAFTRPNGDPAQVQPADSTHVTVPLCDPSTADPLTVARATTVLDDTATAAFTTGIQPPQGELHRPAVLLVAVPAHYLAVAIGIFPDTYAAHDWWATATKRLHQPGTSTGVYPLVDAPAVQRQPNPGLILTESVVPA